MTKVVFFTPAKKPMALSVAEARRKGYGIANTNSRLVLRSPKASLETYTQNVRGTRCTPALDAVSGVWGGKETLCNDGGLAELLLWLYPAGSRSSHGGAQNLHGIRKELAVEPNPGRGCLPNAAR